MLLDIGFDEFVEYTVHRFSVAFARGAKQLLRAFGHGHLIEVVGFLVVAALDRGGCFAHDLLLLVMM